MTAWLTALLLGISQAPGLGWASPWIVGSFVCAGTLCILWVASERTARAPLIDLELMKRKPVWTTNLVALLIGFSMYSTFGLVPQLVQTPAESGYGIGATVTQAGLTMLPAAVGSFVIGLAATRLATRFGAQRLVVAACLVSAVGAVGLALVHARTWEIAIFVGVHGLGMGLAFALLASIVVNAVPPRQTGVATGINANLRTVGGAIGTAVTASVLAEWADPGGFADEAGYRIAFMVQAATLLLAALAGLLVPKDRGVAPQTFRRAPGHLSAVDSR